MTGESQVPPSLMSGGAADALRLASHDMRSPLLIVLGYGELLRDGAEGPLTDAQRGCVDHLLQGARQLVAIADRLSELARPGSPNAPGCAGPPPDAREGP
jgi:signal transduction histidine kinase